MCFEKNIFLSPLDFSSLSPLFFGDGRKKESCQFSIFFFLKKKGFLFCFSIRGFKGLCWRSEVVPEKQKLWKGNSMNWKRKQANWQIDEHMSNYHERRVQQSLGEEFKERSCHTCTKFRSGNRLTERRWVVGWKEMMKCGIDGRARMEKRSRKEANWKQRTRRHRSLVSRVGHFAYSAAQRCAENCRGATDSVPCRVWCNNKSFNLERPETVEVLQNAINRKGGRCSCRDAFAFAHHSKQAKKSLSPSESSEKRLHVQYEMCCVDFDMGVNPDQCLLFNKSPLWILIFFEFSETEQISTLHCFPKNHFPSCIILFPLL